jgi:hypothetical protein
VATKATTASRSARRLDPMIAIRMRTEDGR